MTDYDNMSIAELFQIESGELLTELDQLILNLENQEDLEDSLKSIARVIHTLKGAAATIEYTNIQQFSHAIEDVLSVIKKTKRGDNSGCGLPFIN